MTEKVNLVDLAAEIERERLADPEYRKADDEALLEAMRRLHAACTQAEKERDELLQGYRELRASVGALTKYHDERCSTNAYDGSRSCDCGREIARGVLAKWGER